MTDELEQEPQDSKEFREKLSLINSLTSKDSVFSDEDLLMYSYPELVELEVDIINLKNNNGDQTNNQPS